MIQTLGKNPSKTFCSVWLISGPCHHRLITPQSVNQSTCNSAGNVTMMSNRLSVTSCHVHIIRIGETITTKDIAVNTLWVSISRLFTSKHLSWTYFKFCHCGEKIECITVISWIVCHKMKVVIMINITVCEMKVESSSKLPKKESTAVLAAPSGSLTIQCKHCDVYQVQCWQCSPC